MLRPRVWVVTLVFLALIANIAPVQARSLPNGVIVIDPSDDPPADLLDAEEVERITRLQSADFPLPFSGVSPNDESLLIESDEGLALLDLADGALRLIDPLYFERFVPLPLLGFSAFHWLDTETLGVLAVDLGASDPEMSLVRMLIGRAWPSASSVPAFPQELRSSRWHPICANSYSCCYQRRRRRHSVRLACV